MSEFTVSFNFSAQTAAAITAQLNITGANSILFDKGIQLRPFWPQLPLPPLDMVTINSQMVSIASHEGGASSQQGITVTFAVSANGANLEGDIPYEGGPQLSYSYSFVGYDQRGSLQVGSFSIPFPTS